jgi:spheroidene monooxygenase
MTIETPSGLNAVIPALAGIHFFGAVRENQMTTGHRNEGRNLREAAHSAGEASPSDAGKVETGVACLVLARLRPAHWPWGWSRIAFSRWLPEKASGLRFMKTLGSGRHGGFGLAPSASHQGVFFLFSDQQSAHDFMAKSPLLARYRERSEECLLVSLLPSTSRGSWDGVALASGEPIPQGAPIAALTRASIRPLAAAAFWRHAPDAQRDLAHAEGCQLAIGLGEAPLLRQATFSLWRDANAMDAYARNGAHQEAIRAAWKHQFFSESMFVRFSVGSLQGTWNGHCYG